MMKYRKDPKLARGFLKWFPGRGASGGWLGGAEVFWVGAPKGGGRHPLWNTIDEPMKGFRPAPDNSRTMGFAGPPSAKATEVYSKYVIVDMFAKGVQGGSPEEAVKWAAAELKKIYG